MRPSRRERMGIYARSASRGSNSASTGCGAGFFSLLLLLSQTLFFLLLGFRFNELRMKRNKFCGDPSKTFLGIYLYPAIGLIGYYQVIL